MNYRQLAHNIITRRKALQITQAELARRAGCSASTVGQLERAAYKPSVEMLFKVAAGLCCRASELVEGV